MTLDINLNPGAKCQSKHLPAAGPSPFVSIGIPRFADPDQDIVVFARDLQILSVDLLLELLELRFAGLRRTVQDIAHFREESVGFPELNATRVDVAVETISQELLFHNDVILQLLQLALVPLARVHLDYYNQIQTDI